MENVQLIKKKPTGGYRNIFPKTFLNAIRDKESGVVLTEILQGFNMYFLSYVGDKGNTRLQVPNILRKEGLWITYVLYDHTVVTEWYNSEKIDNDSWKDDSNWRIGSNALVGDISISSDGYWVINGVVTEAIARGEQGITPLLKVGENNRLQVSYNEGKHWEDVANDTVFIKLRVYENKLQQSIDLGKTWTDISDYIAPKFRWLQGTGTTAGTIQISMDLGKTWSNLSNPISNNLRIKEYIGINESLPTSGVEEGTIYMKGPYYAEDDTLNDNPIYRMWIYAWKGNTLAWQDNGEFTSVAAGVVQETGDSETEVMSQKAVTEGLSELALELSDIKGYFYENEHEFTENNETVELFSNLGIKKGDTFTIVATGTAVWATGRIYVYQGEWATKDFFQTISKDTPIEVTTDVDINSLNVRYAYTSGFGNVLLKIIKQSSIIEDRLTSFDAAKALSANQGRILNTKLGTTTTACSSINDLSASNNLIDAKILTYGYYIFSDGTLRANSNMCVSGFIKVLKGLTYTYKSWTGQTNRRVLYSLAYYNSNYEFVSYGSEHDFNTFVVPDNEAIKFVRVTLYTTAIDTAILVKGSSVSAFEPYKPLIESNNVIKGKYAAMLTGNMEYGSVIQIPAIANSISRSEVITFSGTINEFNELIIGMYKGSGDNPWTTRIKIDKSNLVVYGYDDVLGNSFPHGIDIKNNIQVVMDFTRLFGGTITIISNGRMFQKGISWNRRYICYPRAESVNSNLTNCKLSWTCKDIKKDIWMFGDSYLSYSDRWPYYLHQFGYDVNVLMDSYPGENSANAIRSLKNLLTIGTPKIIVWCHGMNDGTDEGTYSTSWKNAIDELVNICKDKNIELVLSTTPTVPSISHEYKNAWVRSSGYRYIDFYAAVGASSDGTWFSGSGMLSNDGIHPTDEGAKALFGRLMSDLPEVVVECS